jgi:aminoglycoside phosphotransferase (APT) family kinase protein
MDLRIYLSDVEAYLQQIDLSVLPGWQCDLPFVVLPLAQGEYNMNYLLQQGDIRMVLRVNMGSQIQREDQIRYEFDALKMLAGCDMTPKPYFLDDSKSVLNRGMLIMEYLPGESLIYPRDFREAARLFARIHSFSHQLGGGGHLIAERNPLSMTFEECSRLLSVYYGSSVAVPEVCEFLQDVLAWADVARKREAYFREKPWWCVINTEVNSSNFIMNQQTGRIHLVDWEKPLWGDPSQDLSHFMVPTTTLWKTTYRMATKERQEFLDVYRNEVNDVYLADTIEERVSLRDPFNCLRGVSWCAMAWVSYRNGEHALQNADTFAKLDMYVDIDFLHSLFDPVLEGRGIIC